MFRSQWSQQDGYQECFISLRKDLAPILRARIVKKTEYAYESVVRDAGYMGQMVASDPVLRAEVNAQERAIELAKWFLMDSIKGELS